MLSLHPFVSTTSNPNLNLTQPFFNPLHVSGGLGRISALVVGSQFKGHGIGKSLVAEAEEFAWENGCARIEITSGERRADAHAFYEAVGYTQDSRRFIKHRPG